MYDPFKEKLPPDQLLAYLKRLWDEKRLAYYHYPAAAKIRYGWGGGRVAHPEISAIFERNRRSITRRLSNYSALANSLPGIPGEGYDPRPYRKITLLPWFE